MNKKWIAVLGAIFLVSAGSARASTLVYSLDFGSSTSPLVTGYTQVVGNFLADTMVSQSGITGSGGAATITFAIDHVGVYSTGTTGEPLTTDGFYTFGNEANDHIFTISGLSAGDQVTLYAVSGWDGNGRGGTITFGGSTTLAQVIGDPGTTPTLSNFTLINSTAAVAGGTGILTGTLLGHNGLATDEGQIGGFIIQVVQAVPEPSTYALFGAGLAMMFFLRRRIKVKA